LHGQRPDVNTTFEGGMKSITLLILLGATVACESTSAPATAPQVDLAFGIHRLGVEPAFVVQRQNGDIVIRGYFEALCSPYTAEARSELQDGTLTLTVIGEHPVACWPAIVALGYQATIRDVPLGHRRLQIVHQWKNVNRQSETVFTVDGPNP
jgi:hypothetical protein